MSEAVSTSEIEAVIRRRTARRNAHANLERMRYANDCMFERIPPAARTQALYVGVGHGLDALLALLDGHLESVVGVDPYFADDGNDDEDLFHLQETIRTLDLQDRFTVVRSRIQDYLRDSAERFTCVVFSDVLHHIYVTRKPLRDDHFFPEAAKLFGDIHAITGEGSALVIRESTRYGVRPTLTRLGILTNDVDYTTKQLRREWIAAATEGGWGFSAGANYVPWKFRNQAGFWSGTLGSLTLCDKYLLWFDHK